MQLPDSASHRGNRALRGAALVFVLAALVLMSILVLVFLNSARDARISSSLYSRGEGVRMLRETVQNLVIGQIREGTEDPTRLWISQPGAIRTYSGSSQPDLVYKLYSAREMIVPGNSFDPASLSDVPTGGGQFNPNVFTDLNAPVFRDDGIVRNGWSGRWNYPILDPAALGVVEGFEDQSAISGVQRLNIPGTAEQPPPQQIPMPVRWLYVMESGAIAAVDDAGVVQDDFLKADGTRDQIVARVAFWTDDESAKLNINTASSGMFWDTPIGRGNNFERGNLLPGGRSAFPVVSRTGLAASPPASREFQRYPGHPATTSLDVVFDNAAFFEPSVTREQRIQKILKISPRNQWGGSEHGAKFPVSTQPGGIVELDRDRLYATVDELFFRQPGGSDLNRPEQGPAFADTPAMNLNADTLSLARFFLTANSRTPEVTSFNTPRVTIWPVDVNRNNRTLFDRTIAFSSTIGSTEYIFTRSAFDPATITMTLNGPFGNAGANGSQSATLDFNANNERIYNYLGRLLRRTFPGHGSSLASKFGADTDQILTQIYDYIRSTNLFDCSEPQAKPYTGRPFYWNEANLMGVNSDNIGGSLRANLDLPRDPASFWNLALAYYVPSAFAGQVVPAQIGDTRGFGRFPTVVGATIGFFATDTNPRKTPEDFRTIPIINFPTSTDRTRANFASWSPASEPAGFIRGLLVLSMANPAVGPLAQTDTYQVRIAGLDAFRVNDVSANFPSPATNIVLGLSPGPLEGTGLPMWDPTFTGPQLLNVAQRTYRSQTRRNLFGPPTGNNADAYPFASQNEIEVTGDTLSFKGGPLTIEILVGGDVVQTINMEFEDFTAPMPRWSAISVGKVGDADRLIDGRVVNKTVDPPTITGPRWDNRIGMPPGNSPISYRARDPVNFSFQLRTAFMPNNFDVLRTMEMSTSRPPFGDARLVAGLRNVPSTYFQECTGYGNSSLSQATSLWGMPQAVNGDLFANASAASVDAARELYGLPSTLAGARRADGGSGDWDLSRSRRDVYAAGFTEAGGFINKPNDSAASFRDESGNVSLPYFHTNASIVSRENSFSPNRMIPSAGMFGSLPVGVRRGLPWQTLLFRPNIPTHPGAANPPDHLLLDLFHMPVVEPYAISEPFSTAGKVNLNWQIAPFSYIKRSTALRGVLFAERITAIPASNAFLFSLNPNGSLAGDYNTIGAAHAHFNYRYPINRNATMTLFEDRFAKNQPFLTASSITEMPLVPRPETIPASGLQLATSTPFQTTLAEGATAEEVTNYVTNFWNTHALGGAGTADNLREQPYTTIYPRVTTKSNTFQVHMKVQVLKKSPGTAQDRVDANDSVVSEYQGSVIIERFLDPTQVDYDPGDPDAILGPYMFRIVETKQFNP